MTIIFDGINNTISGAAVANTQITGVVTQSQLANNAVGVSQMDSTVMSLFPYTNKIINGDFRIWQRGNSFSGVSSGQYTADRWMVSYRTAGVTVAQQNNQYYQAARLTNTDGSVQSFDFEQRIEDTSQFSGATYTLSFYAKASTAATVTAQVYANYGSGGSSQDTVNTANQSITTTRTRFTVPLVFPDMSSKTIASTSWVRVLLSPSNLPAGAWVEYDSVQITYGSTALPFQTREIGTELVMCQRYYEKSYPLEYAPGSNIGGTGAVNNYGSSDGTSNQVTTRPFAVTKRTVPTMTYYTVSGTSGSWEYYRNGTNGTATMNNYFAGTTSWAGYVGVGAAWTSCYMYGQWTASAEL